MMDRNVMRGLDHWLTTPPEQDEQCEVCGSPDAESCVCPECPGCTQVGDPACYQEVDLGICGALYGKETTAQKIGKAQAQIRGLENQIADINQYINILENWTTTEVKKKWERRSKPPDKPWNSKNYTGRIGSGLSVMRFHHKTATGYCRTCRSHTCIMTAYIPVNPKGRPWTWAEQYRVLMAGPA